MNKFILTLFLFALGVSFCLCADKADYCRRYYGDISFSYSTTEDENYWFQNYQNAYTSKKGKEGYTIWRRRTTITRRPHGRHVPMNNDLNSFSNANVFQQQIQQQQVQTGPIPFVAVNQVDGDQGQNETEEEEKKPALPIWKITIPRQVKRAIIARVEDAQIAEHFELNQTHFDNPNLTTTTSQSKSSINAISLSTQYTRTIDITDQSLIADGWYIICIQVNVMQKGEPSTCDHCTLLKARPDSGRQQFLDFDWVAESILNTSAELRYASVDMPFPSAIVRSKVWTKYAQPRCHDSAEHVAYEAKDIIYPEHLLYVDVRNLVGKLSYGVQVDVEFLWKANPDNVLPTPFVMHDYLHSDFLTTTLAKCEDYNYKGD